MFGALVFYSAHKRYVIFDLQTYAVLAICYGWVVHMRVC